jgi:hypothetical protein
MAHSKLYNRACDMLEKADERMSRAPVVGEPHERDAYGRLWWSRDDRRERWRACDWLARLIAEQVVKESASVLAARRLVDRAERAGDVSAYAKAAAARIQITRAVWAEAYGRYFAKWGKEFIV